MSSSSVPTKSGTLDFLSSQRADEPGNFQQQGAKKHTVPERFAREVAVMRKQEERITQRISLNSLIGRSEGVRGGLYLIEYLKHNLDVHQFNPFVCTNCPKPYPTNALYPSDVMAPIAPSELCHGAVKKSKVGTKDLQESLVPRP